VSLVLFDLDNTLVDRTAAYRRWAEWFCAARSLPEDAVEWFCAADADGFAQRAEVFGAARDRFGLAQAVADLAADYRQEYPAFFVPDPDVTEALGSLRTQGWRIGVVTNGPAFQHEKLARAGLDVLVDSCCVSEEVGAAKPAPAIFEAAIAGCGGLDGEQGVMVGDAPVADIGGGHAVGLRTVWIDRGRAWDLDAFVPDAVAGSVPAAVALLLG